MLKISKSGEEVVVGRTGNNRQVVEQFVRPRPRRSSDPDCRSNKNEDDPDGGKRKELLQSETSMQNSQSEVLALKAELDRAQSLNAELQLQNKKLTHDLAAAEAKIAALSCRDRQVRVIDSISQIIREIYNFTALVDWICPISEFFTYQLEYEIKKLIRCPFHTHTK